jgi:hypothetical protein
MYNNFYLQCTYIVEKVAPLFLEQKLSMSVAMYIFILVFSSIYRETDTIEINLYRFKRWEIEPKLNGYAQ